MTTNFMNHITINHPEMKDSVNLGAIVSCTCCGMTMTAASACVDEEGRIYCASCGEPVSIYEYAMAQLVKACELWDIPYKAAKLHGGMSLRFPWCEGDVICHPGSYGGAMGLFETMGFEEDCGDVRGRLTKAQAFETILHAWNNREK